VSTRARLAVAVAIALLSAAGIAILAVHWFVANPRAAAPQGLHEESAIAPFAGYREVRVRVHDRCVRVVVADTAARRGRGLRGVADLGPYGGMLFAQRDDGATPFTMAGVAAPLEVTWYSAGGSEIGTADMSPCPLHAMQCPRYRSRERYRFALETAPGAAIPTHLLPCS
jgi:uncharacterized membrane protein (UPF0127 family)